MTSIIKVDQIQNAAGTAGLVIDADGYLRPAKVCAFQVGFNNSVNVGLGDVIPFVTTTSYPSTLFDKGGDFENSSHSLVAPVTGVYAFSFSLYCQGIASKRSVISPYVNGGIVGQWGDHFAFYDNSSQRSGTDRGVVGSYLLNLSAGDKASLHVRPTSAEALDFYGGHSSFSGHLIG